MNNVFIKSGRTNALELNYATMDLPTQYIMVCECEYVRNMSVFMCMFEDTMMSHFYMLILFIIACHTHRLINIQIYILSLWSYSCSAFVYNYFFTQAHIGVLNKNESCTDEMVDILSYCKDFPTKDHHVRVRFASSLTSTNVSN